jgi:uncharacterized protein
MPNRLAKETSPYLLQHQDNPVDWYPWGPEALERARTEDKPIFLSVGYSACHWCHVMEHESFEDEATARIMNEFFVSIKVDREERPDVDAIYMNAVQAMTGQGGWPMSVFMLPDGRPFYGGTYFPNTARHGMPSFTDVLKRVSDVYQKQRESLERDASNLTRAISRSMDLAGAESAQLSRDTLEVAFQKIAAGYDSQWGGFGDQPKFPPSMTLELLFRLYDDYGWKHALDMATHTLDRMMYGGMYDQIGNGFHRYSVDRLWLVPHFEKMLYDNALLIRAYLYGHQITQRDDYRRIVDEIAAYIKREMTSPEGGFYSSQDADSEGEEGKFFIWEEDALRDSLADIKHLDAVLDYWGVTDGANFEGASILWVPVAAVEIAANHGISAEDLRREVEKAREILFVLREQRIKPGRDEKILTAWNGLMIKSLAEAGRALDRPDYVVLAATAADFILDNLQQGGRLLRTYKDGQAKIEAFLEDYAFMAEALLDLYQSTFDLRWFKAAKALTESMLDLFWDDTSGFYDTARDAEGLITRPQEITDNAIPSGTSSAVAVLVRMAILADQPEWRERADQVLTRLRAAIEQYPSAFAYLGSQLDFVLSQPHEIALVGSGDDPDMRTLLAEIRQPYRPDQVVALCAPDDAQSAELIPLLANRDQLDEKPTAYVCRNFICQLPVTTLEALIEQLQQPSGGTNQMAD